MVVTALFLFFFFFKQKTAYDMRISDWSSDVCSSDLRRGQRGQQTDKGAPRDHRAGRCNRLSPTAATRAPGPLASAKLVSAYSSVTFPTMRSCAGTLVRQAKPAQRSKSDETATRSEVHTSELQYLMRTSYAVFCVKKKKTTQMM